MEKTKADAYLELLWRMGKILDEYGDYICEFCVYDDCHDCLVDNLYNKALEIKNNDEYK